MIATATITPAEFTATCAKVEAINARAAKRGLHGALVATGTPVQVKTVVGALTLTSAMVRATITGTAPTYAGWTFAARIDAVGQSFVTSAVPGAPAIDRSLISASACEHCNTARERKATYVLLGHDRQIQVGSTCINDFLGWEGTFSIFAEDTFEADDFFGPAAAPAYTPESIITVAEAIVRTYGFVRTGDGYSTRDRMEAFIFGNDAAARAMQAEVTPVLADVAQRAAATVAYIASEDFAGGSDYVANMKALVAADCVEARFFGFLASAPAAYARHAQRAAAVSTGCSTYLATVGAKIEVEATISSIRYIEGAYGTTTLYTLTTPGGDVVKWFASRSALGNEEGAVVSIKATVKAHETYAGTQQTLVTRAKAC